MKIVTKNYSLKNGKRSYLVYLKDENDNSLGRICIVRGI